MSQSMGITGQVDHARIQEAAEKVVRATKKYGKAAGIFAGSGEAAKERAKQGFQYITVGTDASVLGAAFRQIADVFTK